MPESTWGGARAGAGTPQRRIQIDLQTARVLRELVRLHNAKMPEGKWTPNNLVEQLIYGEAIRRGALDRPQMERWVAVERGEAETTEPDDE